jgi:hypothetical protein
MEGISFKDKSTLASILRKLYLCIRAIKKSKRETKCKNEILHQPINVPTAGTQAFLIDHTHRERDITHLVCPVWNGGC